MQYTISMQYGIGIQHYLLQIGFCKPCKKRQVHKHCQRCLKTSFFAAVFKIHRLSASGVKQAWWTFFSKSLAEFQTHKEHCSLLRLLMEFSKVFQNYTLIMLKIVKIVGDFYNRTFRSSTTCEKKNLNVLVILSSSGSL